LLDIHARRAGLGLETDALGAAGLVAELRIVGIVADAVLGGGQVRSREKTRT
jgi:hypothetical protein